MKKTTKKVMALIAAVCACNGLFIWKTVRNIHHPKAPAVDPNKPAIACVGDSITFGAGVPLTHKTQSYPAYLQKLVKDRYQVLNYGLSGRTLMVSGDQPYGEENFYQISHDVNADIYIIMLGTNDSKKNNWAFAGESGVHYEEELTAFVRSYLDLSSHPTVYLMQPPKAFSSKYEISDETIRVEIHEIVARVADQTGANLIDLYAFSESHPEWFGDTIHGNAEGNRRIAEYIYEIIMKQKPILMDM